MDPSVKPGDDFFDYAEGTWLKTHPIPSDKSRAGYNYELPDEIELQVRKMVESGLREPDARRSSTRSRMPTAPGWTRPGSRRAASRR